MTKIFAITQKELSGYFRSPMAYIVLLVTMSIFHVFFFIIIDHNQEATLRDVFAVMEFLFVFIVPLLTMKVFAEEKATGTMEFLMTTPTTNTAIVLGKFFGSLIFMTTIIGVIFVYYAIIEFYGSPDRLATFSGILGLWLEGALFVAIGLMASSWTRNQMVAAICTYLILFMLYFSVTLEKFLSGTLGALVSYSGVWSHTKNFSAGLITLSDVTYFVTGIVLSLLITRYCIENRLWR